MRAEWGKVRINKLWTESGIEVIVRGELPLKAEVFLDGLAPS